LSIAGTAGYVRIGRDRIDKDPDQRVQDALSLVFTKFTELQSVRQVHVWLRDEGIRLPVACHKAAEGRSIAWRLPLYNTVHNILTNPVYAGAYAFGRTMSKVSVEDGRKRVNRGVRRPMGRMGRAAQGSARGLHLLERVREEPAGDYRQCDW
jgi:Recombinase